ncbi:MAG TPA: hypothetical protein VGD72_07610 [Mycobacteriales bacterium]|jgi:hypothetical protein
MPNAPTTVALVAGTFGLATSALTLWMQWRDRRRAEVRADAAAEREERRDQAVRTLQAELDASARERDAQRDYEYEARKRLYAEIHPLFFQLAEASELCFERIVRLQGSRSFRLLEDGEGFLVVNTAHRLMAPIVLVHLIQRRLTAVDLRLDRTLHAQYLVARELPYTFGRGEEIAEVEPALEYLWSSDDDRQHLGSSESEMTTELLLVGEPDGTRRCATYPEFESRYFREAEVRDLTQPVRRWLQGANPRTKPVLWRLLLSQAFLCRMLADMVRASADKPGSVLPPGAEEDFTWRARAPLPAAQEPDAARSAAAAYVAGRLAPAFPHLG